MDTYNKVKELFENLTDNEKVAVNNIFCENANYKDDTIYSNDEEFFETYYSYVNPMKVLQDAHHGSYECNDDWVKFNGSANLDSTNYPETFMDVNLIIENIIEVPEKYEDYIDLDFLDEEE